MLADKVNQWLLTLPDGEIFQAANQQIDHLARELYCEYEPTIGPYPDFWQRLESWIDNGDTDDQQRLLFRLASHLFFIGSKELDNLYRVAFNANISQWLVSKLDLALDDPLLEAKVEAALQRTWFCPLTDSMRINAFYHLNHLSGRNFRPDWLSLAKFGDASKVEAFLKGRIDFIVLLEDFIGSGKQITPAVKFAAALPSRTPVLVVPLVICPSGLTTVGHWQTAAPHVSVRPVLELTAINFLSSAPATWEPTIYPAFRDLAVQSFTRVLGGMTPAQAKIYSPFGFDQTGSLVVLVTNCPNNTVPLIHHGSPSWQPLFPRASRI